MAAASITIRPAKESDAHAIAELSTELGYPANSAEVEQRLCRIIGRPNQLVIVAQSAIGQVCGWLQAQASEVLESGFRIEIIGLIVCHTARRQGIGRRLVEAAEAWAREIGAPSVLVRSNVNRTESHLFYPAMGYSPMKHQTVYRKAAQHTA